MTVIDFHTHVFPKTLAPKALDALLANSAGHTNHTDGTLTGLIESMDLAGIGASVTLPVATKPEQVSSINRSIVSLQSDRIISFGALHPHLKDCASECEYLRSNGIKGIKLHPEYQNFHVDDRLLFPLYEACCAANLIIVFHAGKDPGPFTSDHGLPAAFKKVIDTFPQLSIVLAHMGGLMVWDDVFNEIAGLGVYFDTSAVRNRMSPQEFIKLTHKHGIDRILFGSDSPWDDQRSCRLWIEEIGLSTAHVEAVLGGNALRLLTDLV